MSEARRTKVVLLAGGLGTRLRPITETTPKCLVPVAGRPLLDYWFDSFAAAGLRDVLINNHHLPNHVRAYIAQKNATGQFRVAEAFEPKLLGSAGTIHANRAFADDADDVLIVYADNLSSVALSAMLSFHRAHAGPMTMLLFRTPYPEKCGIAQLDANGVVTEFVEKPQNPRGNLANAGVYAVTADAYREMADLNAFDLGFDVLPKLVGRMRGFAFDGYHRDIGSLESLKQADVDAPRIFGSRNAAAGAPR